MRKAPLLGLVCAGPVSRSPWARLSGITEQLGPVKSTSLRAASRACNNIKSGTPVEDYESLAECEAILFSMPDDELEPALVGLSAVREDWQKRSLLIFRCTPSAPVLDRYRENGAAIGWFDVIPGSRDRKFVAEGDALSLRLLRRLVKRDRVEMLQIAPGSRPHFQAATAGLMCLHLPLLAASLELLKRCELPPGVATEFADELLQKSSRSYLRSGKRSLAAADLAALRALHVEVEERVLAAAYEQQLELTREWLEPKSKTD